MAESNAVIAFDVTLEVETFAGSGVFTELAEITNVTPPNASVDDVDVTHMKSPGRAKEFRPGLTDNGEAEFEMNWIPSSVTDTFIRAWRTSGETRSTRLTYPEGETDTFPSYPKGYQLGAQIGDKMSGTLSVKVAGDVVRG
jgi:hypothetical protein